MKITNVSQIDDKRGRNTSLVYVEVVAALEASPTKMIKVECANKREATNLAMAIRKRKGIGASIKGLNVFVFYKNTDTK